MVVDYKWIHTYPAQQIHVYIFWSIVIIESIMDFLKMYMMVTDEAWLAETG